MMSFPVWLTCAMFFQVGLCQGGVPVKGVSLYGGLCPGIPCSDGSLSRWIFDQVGLCLGGSLSRGFLSMGSLSRETTP